MLRFVIINALCKPCGYGVVMEAKAAVSEYSLGRHSFINPGGSLKDI